MEKWESTETRQASVYIHAGSHYALTCFTTYSCDLNSVAPTKAQNQIQEAEETG